MLVLCEKIKKYIRGNSALSAGKDCQVNIFNESASVDTKAWNEVVNDSNFFLSLKYLQLIEKLHKSQMHFRYVIVFKKGIPVAVAYFQIIDFTAKTFGELIEAQISEIQSKRARMFEHYLEHSEQKVVMRIVTCGNNYVSGEYGFAYTDKLNRKEGFEILELVCDLIGREEKLRGKISATLIKDFYKEHIPDENTLAEGKYVACALEPNMIVTLPQNLNSKEDYISTFSKKYRNRAKSIFKAGLSLETKELSYEDLKIANGNLFRLYENVFNKAKFKLVKLDEKYFSEMKNIFPNEFKVFGFYLEGKLVAFDSFFILTNEIEAHYIGFDYELNKQLELYQNILYHLVEQAILNKMPQLNLGRTAAEIKSTVGAKANELTCYIKPQNTVSKVVLNPFINYMQPAEWIPRNPFKEEELTT